MGDVERNYEFWLLGLPENNGNNTFEKIKKLTRNLCVCFELHIPQLRIGTLDLLLKASADLQKLETTTTELISRIIIAMRDVLEIGRTAMKAQLSIKGRPMPHYLHKFHWDTMNFPPHLTIKSLEDMMSKEVSQAEEEVKKHMEEYTILKQNLEIMERNQKGSLMTRNISNLVQKEDFVQGSEHLITVVVVVPKHNFSDWLNTYELLDDEVVPRSSKLLFDDGYFGLFNVTLFKRRLEHFRQRAREMRFLVRDFTYDAERISTEAEYLDGLRKDKSQLDRPLSRLLKSRFSEIYTVLIHIQAMRLFVECILRYGLPVKFLYLFVIVPKKEVKKARGVLAKEYAYLEMTPSDQDRKKKETYTQDYCPYVSFKAKCDISDF